MPVRNDLLPASATLALMYYDGRGVPQDYAEAVKWYRKAAEQGHAEAQYYLALMYAIGDGVPQDYAEAMNWFRKAAEQGSAGAQFNLGIMYDKGRGVPQDYAKAVKWWRLAAEQGHVNAQYNLGVMYDKGQGVPQDYAEAVRWYRKAADQGYASALFNLGIMYDNGWGVPQDYAEAVRWYRKAAEQGDANAQFNLGAMYDKGEGVPQDYIQAHKWYNLAASRAKDGEDRDNAAKNRDIIAKRMAFAQIAEAQRLARAWRPKQHAATSIPPAPDTSVNPFDQFDTPALRSIEKVSTGSGFYVSSQGHVLTNEHVVNGCVEVRIPPSLPVEIVAQDEASDLALLKSTPTKANAAAKFRGGRGIRPGDNIIVVGYPLPGFLASEAHVTTGTVSALAGPGDDRRLFQITAPVQPGNSGGPVLDTAGNAVGVVMAKLDAIRVARVTGDIPQNVNFAVSEGTARAFLDAQDVPYETAPSIDSLKPADVAAKARKFTVAVECWK